MPIYPANFAQVLAEGRFTPFASETLSQSVSGMLLTHSQQLTRVVMFMPMRLISSAARLSSGLPATADRPASVKSDTRTELSTAKLTPGGSWRPSALAGINIPITAPL